MWAGPIFVHAGDCSINQTLVVPDGHSSRGIEFKVGGSTEEKINLEFVVIFRDRQEGIFLDVAMTLILNRHPALASAGGIRLSIED